MSQMELRSSRSRSKTPFLTQDLIENEQLKEGNHVEKTVVRTTRRTTVIKSNENASSSKDEIYTVKESSTPTKSSLRKSTGSKSERSLRSRLLKTSDYSSEDGENEVSSSRTLKQNERNQLIDDARALGNGGERPALELYKRSGRYWDVYPKTDWTYSRESVDRVEIAPGVVAMPNMSRKSIRPLDESDSLPFIRGVYSAEVSDKEVNTENNIASRFAAYSLNSRRNLFNNNSESKVIKRRTYSRWTSFKQTIITVFVSIFTAFYSAFHYSYKIQTGLFSQIHRIASYVMLWDTYLLWKSRPGDKAKRLAFLCLIPLLLLGGIWLLSGIGTALYGVLSSYTSSPATLLPFWNKEDQLKRSERQVFDDQAPSEEKISNIIEEKITEKIYVEPPSAQDIAGSFTKEQLEAIAAAVRGSLNLNVDQVNTEELVEKIVNSPNFVNTINNYYQPEKHGTKSSGSDDDNNIHEELLNKHQQVLNALLKEIEGMKQEILLNNKLRTDEFARLSLNMRKCCEKRPIINVEGYVSRAVADLLNNPDYLRNQRGFNDWLRSIFLAKQDMEYRLNNLTVNMDSKVAEVVEANHGKLMDEVAAKLLQINKDNLEIGKVKHEHIVADETLVRKIVKEVLSVYDADRTGLVDYAMENMGGQIVTTRCTEPYHYGKAVVSLFGIPLWHHTNSPRIVITPTMAPGDCWAFQNFPGFVVIKLSNLVDIQAFSMEHISRLLLPEAKMDSAPKDFEVYGLREENDHEPVLLGVYRYEYNGEPLQFFSIEKEGQVFDMIEVRIISNHGNPNYTCLYRFRVHGALHKEER